MSNSSSIKAHNYADGNLDITFHSGKTYRYKGVDPDDYRKLTEARSMGGHLSRHIASRYKYEVLPED